MATKINLQKELFDFAAPSELRNSLNLAFQELAASDFYSDLDSEDRKKILFHWELLMGYFETFEHPKDPGIFLSYQN
jgi:hypothetical protein